LIGQYLGTDIPFFKKDELYVTSTEFFISKPFQWGFMKVKLLDHYDEHTLSKHWYGRIFREHIVLRRTACMLKVSCQKVYYAYCKDLHEYVFGGGFHVNSVGALTEMRGDHYECRTKHYFSNAKKQLEHLKATNKIHQIMDLDDVRLERSEDENGFILNVKPGRSILTGLNAFLGI
jgi:hypothetical protein